MSPRGRPKRWTRLRRIASTVDSLPGWVLVLVALACLLLSIWLLVRTQGSGFGQVSGHRPSHTDIVAAARRTVSVD